MFISKISNDTFLFFFFFFFQPLYLLCGTRIFYESNDRKFASHLNINSNWELCVRATFPFFLFFPLQFSVSSTSNVSCEKKQHECVCFIHTHTHTNSVLDRPSTFQADVLTIKFSPTSFPQTEYCHLPFLHLRTRAHVFRPTTDVLIYIYIARDTFRHRNSNLIETSLISTTLDFKIVWKSFGKIPQLIYLIPRFNTRFFSASKMCADEKDRFTFVRHESSRFGRKISMLYDFPEKIYSTIQSWSAC